MDKDFQAWHDDLQKRIVERGLDKYQIFRMDMTSGEPHWVMEYQSKDKGKVMKDAEDISKIKIEDTEQYRYQVKVYDKDKDQYTVLTKG